MTEIEARINDLVSTFVNEITRLARTAALDTLNRALAGATGTVVRDIRVSKPAKATAPAATATATASAAKRGKGEKRPKSEIAKVQEQVHAHIRSNPGQRIEQINKVLGTRTPDLALPLKKLIASGAVTTKGARRATTYFPGDGAAKAAKGAAKGGTKKRRGKSK
ncbi:MAG: DNA-binding protein [Myxococcales bacterium]|nr:DNA-binding protein [Myxococcales bacterium]